MTNQLYGLVNVLDQAVAQSLSVTMGTQLSDTNEENFLAVRYLSWLQQLFTTCSYLLLSWISQGFVLEFLRLKTMKGAWKSCQSVHLKVVERSPVWWWSQQVITNIAMGYVVFLCFFLQENKWYWIWVCRKNQVRIGQRVWRSSMISKSNKHLVNSLTGYWFVDPVLKVSFTFNGTCPVNPSKPIQTPMKIWVTLAEVREVGPCPLPKGNALILR